MFSHVTLGTNDLARARRFYEPVMATLAIGQPFALEVSLVFGALGQGMLFVGTPFDGAAASKGNGTHVAFAVDTRAAVGAFHAAALAHDGSDA